MNYWKPESDDQEFDVTPREHEGSDYTIEYVEEGTDNVIEVSATGIMDGSFLMLNTTIDATEARFYWFKVFVGSNVPPPTTYLTADNAIITADSTLYTADNDGAQTVNILATGDCTADNAVLTADNTSVTADSTDCGTPTPTGKEEIYRGKAFCTTFTEPLHYSMYDAPPEINYTI